MGAGLPVAVTVNVTVAPAVTVCESGWVYPQIADWAVARKLAVSIWHLLMGHCMEMQEPVQHLATKLLKIVTFLGKESLKQAGFARRAALRPAPARIDKYISQHRISHLIDRIPAIRG